MRTRLLAAFVVAGLAVATPARGDRYARGQIVFETFCTGCHSVGWHTPGPPEKGRRDLTRVVDRWRDAELLRFIQAPARVQKEVACRHQPLGREQADDVVYFLHLRSQAPPSAPRVPPRSSNPPARPRSAAGAASSPTPSSARGAAERRGMPPRRAP